MKLPMLGTALLLAAASGRITTPLAAQQAAPQKIAIVNLQNIMQQAPGFAHAESTYKADFEGYRNELSKLQASLDSATAEFEQQSVLLSPTARAAKRKELQAQQDKLDQRTNELRDKAANRERELLEPIQSKVSAVIEGLRSEGSYAMIFDVSAAGTGILTADKALDITAKAIQRLQASH